MNDLDPTERRRYPRIRCVYRMRVVARESGFEGFLVDLSRLGARVRFLRGCNLVDARRIDVELPSWLGVDGPLSLPGRFAWLRPADAFRGPEGGFAFDALAPEDVARLDALTEGILRAAEEDGLLAHALHENIPAGGARLF